MKIRKNNNPNCMLSHVEPGEVIRIEGQNVFWMMLPYDLKITDKEPGLLSVTQLDKGIVVSWSPNTCVQRVRGVFVEDGAPKEPSP